MKIVYIFILLLCLVGCAGANSISYGSNYNYSINVLPNGSYVHQGDNISQGYYYDLSGVYGWSGLLAHWKNDDNAGYTYPTNIADIKTVRSRLTYISPDEFPVGKWYQFDGYNGNTCNSDSSDSYKNYAFQHGNAYVFAVVKQSAKLENLNQTIENSSTVYHTTAYVFDGNQSVAIPVTYVVNGTKTATATQAQVQNGMETIAIPQTTVTTLPTPTPIATTAIATPAIITPSVSIPFYISIISILSVVLLYRRN